MSHFWTLTAHHKNRCMWHDPFRNVDTGLSLHVVFSTSPVVRNVYLHVLKTAELLTNVVKLVLLLLVTSVALVYQTDSTAN